MALTASQVRQNIYKILDEVLESGIPVEIERRGRRLRIAPVERADRVAALPKRPKFLRCDPDEIVHLDWSASWRP